jgi:hypothetical protein
MPRYTVEWGKTYVARGTVEVEAESPEQAEQKAFDEIGDYTGTMDYLPDYDFIQVTGEVKKDD